MSNQIQRTVQLDEPRRQNYDLVFTNMNLTVIDTVLMNEEYKKIGFKRFIPFYKGRGVPKIEKKILENVSGLFRFKRFTAIMGASGAGKTSLLTQIAGQLPKDSKVSGELKIQGRELEAQIIKTISGFVFQDDVILETMTVEEALKMSAKLRLPPEIDKIERVEEMIGKVSLKKARKTQIGQPGGKKGISGGERKRTSKEQKCVYQVLPFSIIRRCDGIDNWSNDFIPR